MAQAVGVGLVLAIMREGVAGAVEPVEAVVGGQPQDAVLVLDHCEYPIFAEAGRIVRIVTPGAAHGQVGAEQVEAGARNHPGGAVARLHDRLDQGRVALGPQVDRMKVAAALGTPGQARGRAHPQPAIDDRQAVHHVARQRRPVARLVAQGAGAAARGIVEGQPATRGADPDLAIGAHDDVARLPVFVLVVAARLVVEVRETAAGQVGAADAAETGADPQRAGTVDAHRRHLVVRQAVLVEHAVAVGDEAAAGRFAPLQAVEVGAGPERAPGVDVQRQHARLAHSFSRADGAPLRPALAEAPLLESGLGADPERVARPHGQRRHAGAARVLVQRRGIDHVVGARRQARHAVQGADPERALRIERERVHDLVARRARARARLADGGEAARARVEALQAVAGAEPEHAVAVGDDGVDAAVGALARTRFEQRVAHELAAGLIEARQSSLGAEPEPPFRVFERGVDVAVRQRGGVARVVAVGGEAVAVVAVEAGLGTEPHEALAVLEDGQHRFLRQAVFDRQPLEAQVARRAGAGSASAPQQQAGDREHGGAPGGEPQHNRPNPNRCG